jgi:hypothetical protein
MEVPSGIEPRITVRESDIRRKKREPEEPGGRWDIKTDLPR